MTRDEAWDEAVKLVRQHKQPRAIFKARNGRYVSMRVADGVMPRNTELLVTPLLVEELDKRTDGTTKPYVRPITYRRRDTRKRDDA